MSVRPIAPRFLLLLVVALACLASAANAAAATIARPADAWLSAVGRTSAVVRWTPVAGATRYDVRRGTLVIAHVTGTAVAVRNLQPATVTQIQVIARRGTETSLPSDPVPVVTPASNSCTAYVSPTGSDTASGSAGAPWRTIARLVDSWDAGDVGCLMGDFVEDVSIHRGGVAGAPVVLRSAPGTRAGIRGRIWIADGANYVVVADLDLDGRANEGASRADLPSPTVNGDSAMLLGNDISNAHTRVCALLGSVSGWGRASDTTLAYNRIHDCGHRGDNTQHGIYVESALRTRIVYNAIFRNADRGIQLYPDAQRSLIMRNLIDGNGEGIIFSGAEGYASSGNRVLRNVIARSAIRSNIEDWWEDGGPVGTGNVAVRNCLGGAVEGDLALPAVGWIPAGNVTGTMVYRDASGGDFRPLATSGCRAMLRGPIPLAPFG